MGEIKLSNGDTFEQVDRGDGTHDNYYNGKWAGWGTNLTPEERDHIEKLELKYVFGIDPF